MSPKIEKKRKTQKKHRSEASAVTARILRTLNDKEAFYFYEDIGKPTGQSARSLPDFLEKIKSVRLESLLFHLKRKDFQNWFKETLGDYELARRMARILPSHNVDHREKICSIVEKRMKELSKEQTTLLVSEDLTVVS